MNCERIIRYVLLLVILSLLGVMVQISKFKPYYKYTIIGKNFKVYANSFEISGDTLTVANSNETKVQLLAPYEIIKN